MIAYVFVSRANAGLFQRLPALSEVDYASPTTGPYVGFVKLTVTGGQALHEFLMGPFSQAGAVEYETAVPVRLGPYAPRITVPSTVPLIEAAILVRTEAGRAFAVLHDLDSLPGIHGSAVVAGSFDVLAIAFATTAEGLTHVIGTVSAVDGVVSTQTLLLLRADGVAQGFAIEGDTGTGVAPTGGEEGL